MKKTIKQKDSAIRAITKGELAMKYFPNKSQENASRMLRHWINDYKSLRKELIALGYNPRVHLLTPKEILVIYKHLGQPES